MDTRAFEASIIRRLRFIDKFKALAFGKDRASIFEEYSEFSSEEFREFFHGATCSRLEQAIKHETDKHVRLTFIQTRSWFSAFAGRVKEDSAFIGEVHNTYDLGADPHVSGIPVLVESSKGHFIYKPRPVGLDHQYNKLLKYMQKLGFKEKLNSIDVFDRETYGYTTYVQRRPAPISLDCEELRSVGAILAIVYVLSGRDFHYENIIFSDEGVYLIDLEGMLQPGLKLDVRQETGGIDILSTGILPAKVITPENYQFDPSILGSGAYLFLSGWDSAVCEVRAGFESAYSFFLRNRSAIHDSDPFQKMKSCVSRFIPSSTAEYFSAKARFLVSDYRSEDSLAFLNAMRSAGNFFHDFLPDERVAISNLCVPIFYHQSGKKSVQNETLERQIVPVNRTGFDEAEDRLLNRLSDDDMLRQSWFIQGSFDLHALNHGTELTNAPNDFHQISMGTSRLIDAIFFYLNQLQICLKQDGGGKILSAVPKHIDGRWVLAAHHLGAREKAFIEKLKLIKTYLVGLQASPIHAEVPLFTVFMKEIISDFEEILVDVEDSHHDKENGACFFISAYSGRCSELITRYSCSHENIHFICAEFVSAYEDARKAGTIKFDGNFSCQTLHFGTGLPCLIICICIILIVQLDSGL